MRFAPFDLDAAGGKARHLVGVVCQQPHPMHAQLAQHGRRDEEITLIRAIAQRPVRIECVEPLVLQRIGTQLVHQPDAAAFLGKVDQDARAIGGHPLDRAAQLRPAIAPH